MQVNIDFRGMHTFRMLVQFRASGTATHLNDFRHLPDQGFGQRPDPVGLGKRCPGVEHQRHDKRAFVERGQKCSGHERNGGGSHQHQGHGNCQHATGARKRPFQHAGLHLLEPAHKWAVRMVEALHAREQVVRQHRRYRHRHQHRCKDRYDVGDAQRRKQPAFNARQRKQGDEDQHHDQRGVDDARTHLDGCVPDDVQCRRRGVHGTPLFQPPQDVLHIHHGVIDQFSDCDGQPTQRHHVDGLTEQMECQRRNGEGQGDGDQRNGGGARAQQERKQDDRHHDRAIPQRLHDVADGGFDEVRLTEQDPRRGKAGRHPLLQLGKGLFEIVRQFDGVGGRLLLHADDHCGLSVEASISAFYRCGMADIRNLLKQHGRAVPI
ncbi:hypothetical protein D3C86_1110210 [compost metagenome]